MDKYSNKYKTIQSLFALAVVLLIANLLLERFNSEDGKKTTEVFNAEIKPAKVDSLFIASLKSYNIKQNWIHKSPIKKDKKKSLIYIYKIDVPNDLPNILLIKEIYKNLSGTKLQVTSKEVKAGGTSLLEISNADKLVLSAVFIYKKEIAHSAGYLNLSVILPDDLGDENKYNILNLTKDITLLFSPSTKNIDLANEVSKNNKEFALIINNNIEELKFKIKNSFDESRIRQGVNAILKFFPKTKFILFPSNFNPSYKVKTAFKRMRIKLLYQKNFINFTKKYKTGLKKIFRSYVMSTGTNDTLNVVLSLENIMKIRTDLNKYGNLGYKFITY